MSSLVIMRGILNGYLRVKCFWIFALARLF